MRIIKEWLRSNEEGLSLLELTVVGAIIAILAGLTATAVTGTATETKGIARLSDIVEMQKGSDNYNGQHPTSHYATADGCLAGEEPDTATGECQANGFDADGFSVVEADLGVDLDLDGDIDSASVDLVEINFSAGFESKTFVPSFVNLPKHASDTITVGGVEVGVWVVNTDGKVTVLLPDGSY